MEEFPGNDDALQRLQEVLDTRKAIAFVGAGASAGLYPLWNGLIAQLADAVVRRGLADEATRKYWLDNASNRPHQVVRGIKQALGDANYGAELRAIFGPKAGPDGNAFTAVHGALMRMRFRGYVTTNYDPGLLEARIKLRPAVRFTGYATWKDGDKLNAWLTGDVFAEEDCLILFAHGSWEKPDTVVLGVGEYRQAYQAGPYRRAFEKLWMQDHLVFVGFGFSDTWVDCVADEVLTQTAAQAARGPRHTAFIGLREDKPYTPQMRRTFQDQYNATVVFYRIRTTETGGDDHGELLDGFEALAAPVPGPGATAAAPAVAAVAGKPPQRWVHETTHDEHFVGRDRAIERLDRWADDPQVRVIAVNGMGGQGKTALIGHWLKKCGGDVRRANQGLFYWSFYADRDVGKFLETLAEFAQNELELVPPAEELAPVDAAVALLHSVPLMLVLDGLEVVQEGPGTSTYGELMESDLRQFLDAACRVKHAGLVLLTSRFPFADLTPHLGGGFRFLDLDHLTPDEGAALLERCDVRGSEADRRTVSEHLDGHPLALRVFAAALATQQDGDPTRLFELVFRPGTLREEDSLERKLGHLLVFYQDQLPAARQILLGIVSLFRTQVDLATVQRLVQGMDVAKQHVGDLTDDALRHELDAMCHDHLLVHEPGADGPDAYSCHPVLRDHFRDALLGRGRTVASDFADLLTSRPSGDAPKDIGELQPVLTAIELLLDAGDFKRADELYQGRLRPAAISVFLTLPAPHEGARCALGFVANLERRRQCEAQLSALRLGFYLSSVGLFAENAGEPAYALPFCVDAADVHRRGDDKQNLSRQLLNYTELSTRLGRLTEAEAEGREALDLARAIKDETQTKYSLAFLAQTLAYAGRVGEAMRAFERANEIEKRTDPDGGELYSVRGVEWADLLLRLGRAERAGQLTEANLRICQRKNWSGTVALCHWILGRVETTAGRFDSAQTHLAQAETTMRHGHMLEDLPRVLLAEGDLARRRRAWDEALRNADEALRLAAPRELRLAHADALVLRGRIVLDGARAAADPDSEAARIAAMRAEDDAQAALHLAQDCGYPWAERDALALLSDTAAALDDPDRAVRHRREAEALSQRLRLDEGD